MLTAIRSRIPFLDSNPYPSVREHVKQKIEDKTRGGKLRGVTAQELTASLPYGINTVTARIKELRDRNEVYIYEERECNEMSHNKDVNSYRVRWRHR